MTQAVYLTLKQITDTKKPGYTGLSKTNSNKLCLLNFAFFVHNVLTSNWIILLDLKLARHVAFVLISGVEVTSTR